MKRVACLGVFLLLFAGLGVALVRKPLGKHGFGIPVRMAHAMEGRIFFLEPNVTRLPDFTGLARGVVYTTNLNVPQQSFTLGFPGVTSRNEWFAIDYCGKFWVPETGKYKFLLVSDDGSILYIDDQRLIDNDGIHAALTIAASIHLEAGRHSIRVSYFQGPRYELALSLWIAAPREEYHIFDTTEWVDPDELDADPDERPRLHRN